MTLERRRGPSDGGHFVENGAEEVIRRREERMEGLENGIRRIEGRMDCGEESLLNWTFATGKVCES
jgi:hypothetical protein